MAKTLSDSINTLRSRLASIDEEQVRLLAERDSLAFACHVDREPAAIKRITAIASALTALQAESSTVAAALADASRRELQEREHEMAARRRVDAQQAETFLADAEKLALEIDRAMATLKAAAVAFEGSMASARRLSGAGPTHPALRSHMARAISAGLATLPMHEGALGPAERHSLASITTAWATQIRTRISDVIEIASAKAA
jgi:hypothetical protein